MSGTDRGVVLYKRWLLRDGVTRDDVAGLVRLEIAPHYRTLAPEVVLGLEAHGDDAVLAIQRWPSRAALQRAMTGPRFRGWWDDYRPILAAWEALVEFESEWETQDLLG